MKKNIENMKINLYFKFMCDFTAKVGKATHPLGHIFEHHFYFKKEYIYKSLRNIQGSAFCSQMF